MPQDSLKSAVYRSFVTCDDPKGVVECKTFRKSKIDNPKTGKKVVKQKTSDHLNVSSSERKETAVKGTADELYSSSSLQLMEVSREAQKLNQVIDSWSKGMTIERHSKDIAKDLLKGALDLQESLVMLGKLQEASQHMAKSNKKDKSVKAELDGVGIGRTKSERISDHRFNRLEFQQPRFSVDGASRDCFDELREVIRDSFARQNLLPPNRALEKSDFNRRKGELSLSPDLPSTSFTSSSDSSFEKSLVGRRKMIISSDLPSTSSSQSSSMVQSQEVTSFDYIPPKVKPEGPNLIARLMGLEAIPKTSTTQKQLENDRIFKQRRPIFEIDLPKAKKLPLIAHKVDEKRRTLDEIIDTMHFKGLLRSKSMDKSHQSSVLGLLPKFVDDSPPIVIMKPLYAPDLRDESFPPCIHEEKTSSTKSAIGKREVKKESSPEHSDDHKGTSNFTMYRKSQTGKDQNTRFTKEKGCKDRGGASANSKTVEVLSQEKQPSSNTRASSPSKLRQPMREEIEKIRQPKKEAIEKRVDRTKQVAPAVRKPKETKNAKPNNNTKFQDQSKMITTKVRKPERKPLVTEAKMIDPISKRITTTSSPNSTMRKKNVKTDKSIKNSRITMVNNTEHKNESSVEMVDAVEKDINRITTEVTTSEELHFEDVADISENVVIDTIANGESSPCESTVTSIHCVSNIKLVEHTNCNINLDFPEKENINSRATTRYLLLSSEAFLCQAEVLFETDAWEPTVWRTTSVDHEITDGTLLLDCANEFLENKKSLCALAVDPLSLKAIKTPKISISFDKLVTEICDGIEVLKSYHKATGDNLSADTLYTLLEKDVWCKGVVGNAWDLGWRKRFTNSEVEQVVTDIEKDVLTGVIDDLLTELRL